MRQIKLTGKIVNKQFIPDSQKNHLNAMTIYNDKKVMVTVGPITKDRTNKQNAYLFGGPYKYIEEYTGSDTASIHHEMKEKFASVPTSGPIKIIEQTSKMTTVRFMKYVDDVIKFAAEFCGVFVPYPNEAEIFGDTTREKPKGVKHA